jgi:hypothetical protein
MANKNFNGVQINQSVTIVEKAGTNIDDCRNRIMTYDDNGSVILANDGKKNLIGVALIESGLNDISGKDSGKIETGDDVDIQIKDIGYILAGADIAKGAEVTAGKDGLAATAATGDYVVGIALTGVQKDEYCRVQINKYQKN